MPVASGLATAWQQDLKTGTAAGSAYDVDCAAVGPNDALHGGETQTATRQFGGKEWIKHSGADLFGHPTARVTDFQPHVVAKGQPRRISLERAAVNPNLPSGHSDDTSRFSDRFRSIRNQVHHDLTKLTGIGGNGSEFLGETDPQYGAFCNRNLQELKHLGNQLRNIDGLELYTFFPCVGHHLSHDL